MKTFITYFDLLGYKSFIEKNELEVVRKRILGLLHDVEMALALFKNTRKDSVCVPDINHSELNCLTISDTIVFWAKNDSFDGFMELLKVSFEFNHISNCGSFPARGAMVFGELDYIPFDSQTNKQSIYRVNSIFGKGLVEAHIKAESLDLAGCVIDNSVIDQVIDKENGLATLKNHAVLYNVPYKNKQTTCQEYMIKFSSSEKINDEAFCNRSKQILRAFKNDKKDFNNRAKKLFRNTLSFLEKQKG